MLSSALCCVGLQGSSASGVPSLVREITVTAAMPFLNLGVLNAVPLVKSVLNLGAPTRQFHVCRGVPWASPSSACAASWQTPLAVASRFCARLCLSTDEMYMFVWACTVWGC